MTAVHIILGISAYILWVLIGIAFPVYALARSAYLGYRSGLLVRLPAKLFAGLLLGYVATAATAAAGRASTNVCYQLEYSADRFYTIALPAFVVVMLVSRLMLVEPALDQLAQRHRWHPRIRTADSIGGCALDFAAAIFILQIFLLSIDFVNSPLNKVADLLQGLHFPGVSFLANLPYLLGGILQLQQKLHVGEFAYAHLAQSCPTDVFTSSTYSGIFVWTALLVAITMAPLAFTVSFQSIFYRPVAGGGQFTEKAACPECHGAGTYGPAKPLLLAGLCERCLGSGRQAASHSQAISQARSAMPSAGALIIRGYLIALGIYLVVPIVVLVMYAGIRHI